VNQSQTAKLADFGTAQFIDIEDDKITSARGTYEFLAPECCAANKQSFSGKAVDIWAFGVTVYALAYNDLPFHGDNHQILKAI